MFYVRSIILMTIHRRIKRVGGSLGVLIPRDIAEAMSVESGSEVRLTLVGRQMVVEPVDDEADDRSFQRAFAAVIRRHGPAFEMMAADDRRQGTHRRAKRSKAASAT